ncbi:DUF5107 domain-containing protein [Diplocloster hominis]|uniref:DUF5107 domain-containing protein n=1 Tax=Diplocloster hominis TaxID=3079010 RepID=UPI0031BA2D1A
MNSLKKENIKIPTYVPAEALELPMFFENKPYQGASGKLYPLPFSDSINDEKTDVEYEVYTLENEYIKVQVLPQIGGKILRAYDKTGNYDFVYYNEVIKPALVGLAGPWISGGIEFNWPQHHRPTTYMPLEAVAEEGKDGSKTVWTGEIEPFQRMKGMAGISIEPGRSYIKAKIRIYNRTSQPQVFMWWANLAAPAGDSYQTIFPPDVEWVNDHDRRAVMSWPIAKGIYETARPYDYGEGTDLSDYTAIKVPSSFLVSQGQSDMDFVAGYDREKQKGIVTVADHHIAPGKKLWHWGAGEFGDMWCSNLTDKNGPYIELMTGVYTDNQPDFTWIGPYETRYFEQIWYPIREIGDVKNATAHAAINVEQKGDRLFIGVNTTGTFADAMVKVMYGTETIFEERVDMDPETAYLRYIPMNHMEFSRISAAVLYREREELVTYRFCPKGVREPICVRKPVLPADEINTVEELYINGLHLEQYKQHNYDARDYYLEGLRRDPGDIRCNTAMARLELKNGEFDACIRHCDQALERQTMRNQHPDDTQALYLKGLALLYQDKTDQAYGVFHMAGWDYRYRSASYFELAALDCRAGRFGEALEKLDISLSLNADHIRAMNLKAILYRKMGNTKEAKELLEGIQRLDRLDMLSMLEWNRSVQEEYPVGRIFGHKTDNYLDAAFEYIHAGMYEEALQVLQDAPKGHPMPYYVMAGLYDKMGEQQNIAGLLEKAEALDTKYCFPSRLEEMRMLEAAVKHNPEGANAFYYLGCLFYDKFRYSEAVKCWEECVRIDPGHGKAYRNLALAYYDKQNNKRSARLCMEKAMECRKSDSRILFEYQQLLKNMDVSPERRLKIYECNRENMEKRDDCYLDYITLQCMTGQYEEAIRLAKNRHFHIYEGGEGKLTKLHAWLHVLLGRQRKCQGRIKEAEEAYLAGARIPKSYGEAKTFFNQEAHLYYYLGCLYEQEGEREKAGEAYEEASGYKAAVSEISLFRALALQKTGKYSEAKAVLDEMIQTAKDWIEHKERRSYYGVGSPSPMPFENDIVKSNLVNGYALKAFALLGFGDQPGADACMAAAKTYCPYVWEGYLYSCIKDEILESKE